MSYRTGFSTASALVCVACVAAASIAGYTTFTGKTLCSLTSGCGESISTAMPVAAKSKSVKDIKACAGDKGCCALAKLAKSKSATREELDQAKSVLNGKFVLTTGVTNDTRPVVVGGEQPVAVPAVFYSGKPAVSTTSASAGCCSSSASNAKSCCTKDAGKAACEGHAEPIADKSADSAEKPS